VKKRGYLTAKSAKGAKKEFASVVSWLLEKAT
jgi:hypothetical protein